MIKLGHMYFDTLSYWHKQRSKSCPAGTLRPRGLPRQFDHHEDPNPTSIPDVTIEDSTTNDHNDNSPSDTCTTCWSDIVQFSHETTSTRRNTRRSSQAQLKC